MIIQVSAHEALLVMGLPYLLIDHLDYDGSSGHRANKGHNASLPLVNAGGAATHTP